MSKPLEGIRILDFTQFFSGPVCTLMLSDFGAEVIKLENPPAGDATRYGNVVENETSTHYSTRNRGKKSVAINMKDEVQKNLFLELVKTADAVVENFKPGTMEKFGITYELLESINPKIVYTSISGFGQSGPYAKHAAFDTSVQAESGLMSITGQVNGTPLCCGAAVGDYVGGLQGCIGTLMGIIDAQRTGHGRRIDASMMESLVMMEENQLSAALKSGKIPGPHGNANPASAPIGDFMCMDGIPIIINISTDVQWKKFCTVLGREDLLENPDYASMSLRAAHREELDNITKEEFMKRTNQEVCDLLQSAGLVYGAINNFGQLLDHPQLKHRQTFVTVNSLDGVQFQVPGNPIAMSGMERQLEYDTVPMGYNTIEILSEVADEETMNTVIKPLLEKVDEHRQKAYHK